MRFRAAVPAALALLSLSPPAAAQACAGVRAPGTVRLDVVATEVRNTSGEVAFTVYPDDRSRFLAKRGKLARVRMKAASPATRACFWLSPGHYAVATYHDENGDHDFNRTLFSIKEGFGFSNDASTTLGVPSFAAARFALPANGAEIRVRTRYRR